MDAGSTPVCGRGRRCDADEVGTFFDAGTEFAQFCRHGREAVGLLDAPAGDIAQRGGAVGVQRHHRQCHGGVGNVVAIEVNGLQRPGAARYLQPVRASADVCAHGARGFDETDVSLNGLQAHAHDFEMILACSARCYR